MAFGSESEHRLSSFHKNFSPTLLVLTHLPRYRGEGEETQVDCLLSPALTPSIELPKPQAYILCQGRPLSPFHSSFLWDLPDPSYSILGTLNQHKWHRDLAGYQLFLSQTPPFGLPKPHSCCWGLHFLFHLSLPLCLIPICCQGLSNKHMSYTDTGILQVQQVT